jgi:hypothetical protein
VGGGVKVEIFVDGKSRGTTELDGPGLIPYAHLVSGLCGFVAGLYSEVNPDSPDYLTVGGVQVSLKSRVRTPRRRRS